MYTLRYELLYKALSPRTECRTHKKKHVIKVHQQVTNAHGWDLLEHPGVILKSDLVPRAYEC